MPCGSWQWPDSAASYGQAFSTFPHLQELAINHNEDIQNYEVDESSPGKFTYDCTEKGAELRLAFAEEVAKKCSRLKDMAFCPLEQEKSRIQIRRGGTEETKHAKASFVNEGCSVFWQHL
jgi:hypothetical protein